MTLREISSIAAMPLLVAAAVAYGANASIYRCQQSDGTMLYTDYPCDGAKVVDIHPGAAAPDAKERLLRAQTELERAAADRRALEREAAQRREEMNRMRPSVETTPQSYAEPAYYYAGDFAYGPVYDVKDRRNRFDGRGVHRDDFDKHRIRRAVPAMIHRPQARH